MYWKLKINSQYFFGENVVSEELTNQLLKIKAKTVLLAYGGGSIKRNGLYQEIIEACKKAKVKVIEHSGIEPNPRDVGIYQAALTCRKNKVDLILAAGGGSVIDAAKVIGIVATNPQYKNAWDYVTNNKKVTKPAIPLFSFITLAATGSESNNGSVITNAKTHFKQGVGTPSATPLVCFEDPKYTLTLSWWQTACGIFDIFSHLLEQYYDTKLLFDWTKAYIIANMKVCMNCAKTLSKNNQDYNARSNLLWTSSWALNDLAAFHSLGGDWTTHKLEHAVSGLWDVEHGAGLALLTPTYLKYQCKHDKKFSELTKSLSLELFGSNSLNAFFDKLDKFISLLGLPKKYTDFKQIKNVAKDDIKWLTNHFCTVMKHKPDSPKAKLAFDVFNSIKI